MSATTHLRLEIQPLTDEWDNFMNLLTSNTKPLNDMVNLIEISSNYSTNGGVNDLILNNHLMWFGKINSEDTKIGSVPDTSISHWPASAAYIKRTRIITTRTKLISSTLIYSAVKYHIGPNLRVDFEISHNINCEVIRDWIFKQSRTYGTMVDPSTGISTWIESTGFLDRCVSKYKPKKFSIHLSSSNEGEAEQFKRKLSSLPRTVELTWSSKPMYNYQWDVRF